MSSYRPDDGPRLSRLSGLSRSASYRPAPYERDPYQHDSYRPRPRLADRFEDLEERLASIEAAVVRERRRPPTPPLPSRLTSSSSSTRRELWQRQTNVEIHEMQDTDEHRSAPPSAGSNLPSSLVRLQQKVADLEQKLERKDGAFRPPRLSSEAPSEPGVARLFSRMQV